MFRKELTPREEHYLSLILKIVGTMSLTAFVFVFVPHSWMSKLHQLAGLGIFPAEPIVGYLARSVSAFYAFLGVIKWIGALDVRRYRTLNIAISAYMVLFGVVFLFVDYLAGLGLMWAVGEAGMNIFFGVIILWLALRTPRS